MIKPTIHLNGTSPEGLYTLVTNALRDIHRALAALDDAAPNERDYYPQGPDAFGGARVEHESRVRRLVEVRKELEEIQEHIADWL